MAPIEWVVDARHETCFECPVKDFTLNTDESNPTVNSTSLSRPLKIWPRADLSSAACSNKIRATTTELKQGKSHYAPYRCRQQLD